MKNFSLMLGFIIVLSVLLLGCTDDSPTDTSKNNVGNNVDTPGAPVEDKTQIVPEISNVISTGYYGKILAGDISPYIEFNTKDYEVATNAGKVILLYFYSDVGTLSQGEEYKLFRAFDEMDSKYMIGFKVHFGDSATTVSEAQLAKDLGVKESRTKVILKDGKVKTTSTKSWDINDYATQMAAYLG
jgi:hypothetical protein